MKDFLVTDYVFSPGTSGVGYVEFLNLPDFDITRVVAIINQTQGVVIYATGSASTRYTSVSGRRVFLNVDTSTHNAADKLQVVYNSASALQTTDNNSQDLIKLLSRLVKVMENQQACDAAQRQRVTIDNIAASLTLGTVSTVTTVTTVSTVSNITQGTITNTQQIAGMNQEQYINIARNTYANSIRTGLTFT
jgi:hypothetical protein